MQYADPNERTAILVPPSAHPRRRPIVLLHHDTPIAVPRRRVDTEKRSVRQA
jgi:hypothetical protein